MLGRQFFRSAGTMIFLMPDTCVWISLLELPDLRGPLKTLEELVAGDVVQLWTTEEIRAEYDRDKYKKVRRAGVEKSLLTDIKNRVNGQTEKELAEAARMILDTPRLYDRADQIQEALVHVDDLLSRTRTVEGTAGTYGRVLRRIGDGLAPFHRNESDVRIHIDDGMIIEKFATAAAETDPESDLCVFISLNKEEFATPTNPHEHHAHYSNIFGEGRIFRRFIERTVFEIKELVDSGEIPSGFRHSDRKSWNEIVAEIALVGDHDWSHRHLARKGLIEDGTFRLKPGRSILNPGRLPNIGMDSWLEELAVAERKITANPGLPKTTDPYQAGFAAGALKALKWVKGEVSPPSEAMRRPSADLDDEVEAATDVRAA